jgi:hypothetical protein
MKRKPDSRTKVRLILVAAIATGALILVAVAGTFSGEGTRGQIQGSFSLAEAQAFKAFPVYNAGDEVAGLSLAATHRRADSADFVSFIYGTCYNPTGDACAPPAEVQNWPACRRHLGLYKGPYSPVPEPTTVRGAPAAFFEGGRRLEIQTGRSTVVVFARERSEALEIAEALRGVNVPTTDGDPLPRPAPGALTGAVACSP